MKEQGKREQWAIEKQEQQTTVVVVVAMALNVFPSFPSFPTRRVVEKWCLLFVLINVGHGKKPRKDSRPVCLHLI